MVQGGVADPDRGIELLWRDGGSRAGLSLNRIVRAAVAVADAEGLAGLSMRKVAERLGFTSMSLYRHVPGRDQLVELMRDAVLAELGSAPAEGEWRPRLEACAREGWELRKRHPWLAEASGSRSLPGPNAVAHYERLLGILAGTGLAPAEVIASAELVERFVNSEAVALAEAARAERSSGVTHEEWWGARGSLFERLDRFPVITALWEAGGYDEPLDSFEFGLARVLDGIELLVQSRDEKRDEKCRMCDGPVEQASAGRPRAYCSRACQQRAYRQRKSS
ncbi:TetR/AcrR family transcriptional regulator [Saccharopolyspora indica]|uniref:TetR/AcrR family transcriptional regulator C-terminal domain-containing protein n=1 Tax=Saccharopolyspora indica TaxID=1229659 RepID=UPI0022EA18A1|nr:TetR/AcrR family transcriptional regulator C-terminal domain-containing protein [Saccharopolyspora indica]MDA3647521.1 TetR/AcrR family transcriptional regulator C-terminal domain-containing protein [Saccharopolyspora indica]